MLDILAFSPHPDDVELCCGGLIAKMSERGYRVGIVDLTKGELGTEGAAETRLQEAARAAEILGVQIRESMDFGDCKLGSGFNEAKRLAGVIRQYRPSVVLVPYGDAHHPDHAAGRELGDKAVFFAKLAKVQTGHEVHRVKMVAYYMLHESFNPSFVVDISESYSKKLQAVKAYESQMRLMRGRDGLLESMRLRDRLYGSRINVKHGEAFLCNTPLKIDDLVAFLR